MDDKNYKILMDNEKMAMPFFSVIMLTYNACSIVEKALKGIYNQTFDDFELLLINDCSTDNTDEIVKANTDNRIIYVKNDTNQGVGKSRQLGVSLAKGQYIVFADVDDVVDNNLLFELKTEIDKHNPDFIIYGYEEKYVNEKNKLLWSKKRLPFDAYKECGGENNNSSQQAINSEKNDLYINDTDKINDLMIYLEDATVLGYPWNKCYKRQIVKDNDIHFEDISIYEDIFFNLDYYKKINSISLINKSLYIYNNKQNNKSITKKDYDNYFELSKERVKRIYCFLKDKNKLSTNTLSILKRIYIRYAYSELNRCINRKYGTKQLLQRFDEIRKDELFEEILNELKICGNNKTAKLSFGRAMQDCFVNNKKAQAILISRIINFINKYMYWLYLKIAK